MSVFWGLCAFLVCMWYNYTVVNHIPTTNVLLMTCIISILLFMIQIRLNTNNTYAAYIINISFVVCIFCTTVIQNTCKWLGLWMMWLYTIHLYLYFSNAINTVHNVCNHVFCFLCDTVLTNLQVLELRLGIILFYIINVNIFIIVITIVNHIPTTSVILITFVSIPLFMIQQT